MREVCEFDGKVLDKTSVHLGEGPTYDPATDTAYWFSILDSELHELKLSSGEKRVYQLPCMSSVLARIDDKRQAVVSEQGIFIRDVDSGKLELVTPIEEDRPDMRSNDGRIHPSGSLWFGTMKKGQEGRKGAGTIYHVAKGVVTKLFEGISIPNGICFSPDGSVGYYVDTMENRYMRVNVDPETGLPLGEAQIFIDRHSVDGGIDGSVCDADAFIWNARWGIGEIHRYSPEGKTVAIYKVPALQTTCPAFIGKDASRLLVTSAREGLSVEDVTNDPNAGQTFDLGIAVNGIFDPVYKI